MNIKKGLLLVIRSHYDRYAEREEFLNVDTVVFGLSLCVAREKYRDKYCGSDYSHIMADK
jgi:hypothetical protein